jgi:vacuolar iron transporter family protein
VTLFGEGGNLGVETVLVLGFSNIFADAFSMGMGEYLSSKAHNEFVMKERAREQW